MEVDETEPDKARRGKLTSISTGMTSVVKEVHTHFTVSAADSPENGSNNNSEANQPAEGNDTESTSRRSKQATAKRAGPKAKPKDASAKHSKRTIKGKNMKSKQNKATQAAKKMRATKKVGNVADPAVSGSKSHGNLITVPSNSREVESDGEEGGDMALVELTGDYQSDEASSSGASEEESGEDSEEDSEDSGEDSD